MQGSALLGLALAVVLVASCLDLQRARVLYLSLAMFHIYLEVILLTRCWILSGSVGSPDPSALSAAGGA